MTQAHRARSAFSHGEATSSSPALDGAGRQSGWLVLARQASGHERRSGSAASRLDPSAARLDAVDVEATACAISRSMVAEAWPQLDASATGGSRRRPSRGSGGPSAGRSAGRRRGTGASRRGPDRPGWRPSQADDRPPLAPPRSGPSCRGSARTISTSSSAGRLEPVERALERHELVGREAVAPRRPRRAAARSSTARR